ncbi:class I SAM-dependent methyltransferase [bacterium]|nr:class I SAM-dependent methyltransferase [bacterium]MBU1025451.1 class I SAM-dependent methyltransferase [bacterium]
MENFDIEKILKIASRELITENNCDFSDIPWEEDDFSLRILPLATRSREQTIAEADFIERVCDIKPGMNLLDIASGNGRLSIEFATRGYNVTGIDKGLAAIDFSNKTAKLQNVHTAEFIHSNAVDAQISESYDCAIIIFGAMANFTHDEALKLIGKLSTSLVPPGYLIIELCCLTDNVTCVYQEWYFSDTRL